MGSETFLEVILAILLPPVGVFLRYGCGVDSRGESTHQLRQGLKLSSSSAWTRSEVEQLPLNFGEVTYLRPENPSIEVPKLWPDIGGVLDMFVADNIGLHTGDYIRDLCFSWIVIYVFVFNVVRNKCWVCL
ncbi:hypothetical protein ACOSP7_032748 [Xanthoceras sorbifolium]